MNRGLSGRANDVDRRNLRAAKKILPEAEKPGGSESGLVQRADAAVERWVGNRGEG